jgi:hypothetical protein
MKKGLLCQEAFCGNISSKGIKFLPGSCLKLLYRNCAFLLGNSANQVIFQHNFQSKMFPAGANSNTIFRG